MSPWSGLIFFNEKETGKVIFRWTIRLERKDSEEYGRYKVLFIKSVHISLVNILEDELYNGKHR
jgi:hypothetical protein